MRKLHLLSAFLAGASFLALPGTSPAQAPAQPQTPPAAQFTPQSLADLKALNALIAEIQAQQKTLADNQTAIDQKLATLTETIRVARIFSKRGGGGGGTK
jgi:hypothetical protein